MLEDSDFRLQREIEHGGGTLGKGVRYCTVEAMLKSRREYASKVDRQMIELRKLLDDCGDACNVWRRENAELQSKLDALMNTSKMVYELADVKAERDALALRLDAALGLLRDVATSGVEFEDERVSYVTVQIDSDTLAKIRAVEKGSNKS